MQYFVDLCGAIRVKQERGARDEQLIFQKIIVDISGCCSTLHKLHYITCQHSNHK